MKQHNSIRKIFVILFALLPSLVFPGQPMRSIDSFQHHTWTIDDGLPMNSVNAITQTPDGYLWLGTEAGLARFDGIKFEVFNHENTPAFSNDIISSLQVDRCGTLWIGARGGGVIRYKNGTFKAITGNSRLLGSEIWCIEESMDGSIWIGSGAGLCRFANNSFTRIPLPETSSNRTVRSLLEDRNGHTWAGAGVDGLLLVKKRGGEFYAESMGLAGLEILTLFEDRKGAIWIGTNENGLYRYWEGQWDLFNAKNGLANQSIGSLYEDRFGNIWIGTQGGGINILPAGSDRISVYPNQGDLTGNFILYFYQDREGTLWIGTNGGGLNSLRETEIITYSTKNGLSHNNIYGVFQDNKNQVWVGTKGYGVNYFKDNRFYTLTMRDGLSSDSVVSFAQDRSGAMWFGTLGGGIDRFKNGRFEVFDSRRGGLNNSFRSVYADPEGEGRILAGSTKGDILEFRNEKFTPIADVKSRVNTLFKDSRGNLWAGTFGSGLCRVNENGKIEVFNEKKGLSNNIVTCIHEDKQGILWVGTIKGLNRFQDGRISIVWKKDGLPDDTVYWILEDHNADFWISSNRGIYCLTREEADAFFKGTIQKVNPSVFGKEAGMRSIECNGANQPAGWKSRDGKLWFPTTDGVSVIDPKDTGRNKPPSPVVIEKIMLDGECCPVSKNLTLPPGKNNLEIHYTALSFIVPGKILFKYKLEGFDKKWLEPGSNRTAYYTNLPPGKYVFRVIARSSYGVWNDTGAQASFYLKPKFYQTLFFKIVLMVLAASLLPFPFLYFRKYIHDWRLRRLKRLKYMFKSKNSTSPVEETKKYIRKLMYLLEVEKIYKDSDLSIKSVASKLLLSSRNLSEIINDELKMSFIEFITEFRIKEAQRILSDPKTRDKSVLDIAYDVGYNSKSAFNRAFKNITGTTPSQFRKNAGK